MKKITKALLVLSILFAVSCDDGLTEVNQNPNGVDPSVAHPNLLISTVMSGIATDLTNTGYTGIMGHAAQHIQKDSWDSNLYDWKGSGWRTYYSLLTTNKLANERAVELGLEFHEGVSLVLRAMLFGTLTNFYGDVPYTDALQGNEEGDEFTSPKYDSQESIYKGVIADLERASVLLSKGQGSYSEINPTQDVYFQGDVAKWHKFANSLTLRYYMRLSERLPAYAEAGVRATVAKSLITSVDDECVLPYIGSADNDSWPSNGSDGGSGFIRVKPCATLTDLLKDLDDPRLAAWVAPVAVPIKVVDAADLPGADGEVVDGVRYFDEANIEADGYRIYNAATYKQDKLDGWLLIDTSDVYVALPVAVLNAATFTYNRNPSAERGGDNRHVSLLHPNFDVKSGAYAKSRVMSAAEVHFLMAEAGQRGWGVSNPSNHHDAGISASLEAWGIAGFDDYIMNADVTYDGTLARIMEQKWISNFANSNEAWFDWRRTALPALDGGPWAEEEVMPIRYQYDSSEIGPNGGNYTNALNSLSDTGYGVDGVDGTYSKIWLMQGSGVAPW